MTTWQYGNWKKLIVHFICGRTLAILCSLPNWRSPSHYIFICQQDNVFYLAVRICYCKHASRTSYARAHYFCTWRNTKPYNCRQFGNEQSIAISRYTLYVFALFFWSLKHVCSCISSWDSSVIVVMTRSVRPIYSLQERCNSQGKIFISHIWIWLKGVLRDFW